MTTGSNYHLTPESKSCHLPWNVVMFQCEKIAGEEMLFWQQAVIEFLIKEEIPTLDMHA
jgi:hypothetical protein